MTTAGVSLIIPALNIHLPIRSSQIIQNKWETVTDGVSHLATSPLPGEQGNSVIYGHNWPNLLGNLKKIKPGEQIIIKFGSKEVIYLVHYLSRVSPAQSSVFDNTSDYRLTLYTCIGLFDQERLVVTAFLQ